MKQEQESKNEKTVIKSLIDIDEMGIVLSPKSAYRR